LTKAATRVQLLHGEYDNDPYVNRASHEAITAIDKPANDGHLKTGQR
jgi:hypothetical protein